MMSTFGLLMVCGGACRNANCAVIASTAAAAGRTIWRLSRLGGQLVLDGGQFLLDGGLGSDCVELRLGLRP